MTSHFNGEPMHSSAVNKVTFISTFQENKSSQVENGAINKP